MLPASFTGEEAEGRFVDMEYLYNEFYNLKKVGAASQIRESLKEQGGYLSYLQNFDHFHEIPQNIKEKEYRKYRRYLDALMGYLSDFFTRTQPLADFSIVEKQINDDFNYKWKEGTIRGWEKEQESRAENGAAHYFCQACDKNFSNDNTYIVVSESRGPFQREEAQEEPGVVGDDKSGRETGRAFNGGGQDGEPEQRLFQGRAEERACV